VPFGYRIRWRRLQTRALAFGALGAFLVGTGVLVAVSLPKDESTAQTVASTTAPATTAPPATTTPPKPVATPLRVNAVAAYDPFGDDHENDDEVGRATDGDRATYWSTERYSSWFKDGVGLVVDAGRPVRLATLRLQSETPGFTAEIQAGTRPEGPFTRIVRGRKIGASTVVRVGGKSPRRYVLIWITQLGATPRTGGAVRINEVRATALTQEG
jgi:hypothetical protein